MNAGRVDSERVGAFLDLAVKGDGRGGVRLALELLDSGIPFEDVVHLLAAAQREVGERWLSNDWSVADEHLVSGVTQQALDALATAVVMPAERPAGWQGSVGGAGLPDSGGVDRASPPRVVVACAEGDWHSLAAQMLAELLRTRGYAVAFLGASTPVAHVSSMLERGWADALAVSCNIPLFFGGVTRLADAAHAAGVPVIAGGRALNPHRAAVLGADAWAAGVDDAAEILLGWHRQRPALPSRPTPVKAAAADLDQAADEVAFEAFSALEAGIPRMDGYDDEQRARSLEDLAYITRFVAAARLVDDVTVFTSTG